MYMKFSVLSFQFTDDEPGMFFGSGSDCPQASQMCCDSVNGVEPEKSRR